MLSPQDLGQVQEMINAHKTTINNAQASLLLDPKKRTHQKDDQYLKEIDEANAEISRLQDMLDHPEKYDSLTAGNTDMVQELSDNVEELTDRVTALESLPTRIKTLEDKPAVDLSAIESRLKALEEKPAVDFSPLDSRISALEQKVKSNPGPTGPPAV